MSNGSSRIVKFPWVALPSHHSAWQGLVWPVTVEGWQGSSQWRKVPLYNAGNTPCPLGAVSKFFNTHVFRKRHFSLAKDKAFSTVVPHTISTTVKNSGVRLPGFGHASLLNLLGASFFKLHCTYFCICKMGTQKTPNTALCIAKW